MSARVEVAVEQFKAQLDVGFCGARSADVSLTDLYPPAVCILPAGHEGMHATDYCRWLHPDETARAGGTNPQ